MSDITMCTNDTCPLRLSCYRHTAPQDPYWQSFRYFEPNDDGSCDSFWDSEASE